MKYKTKKELSAVVKSFEDQTVRREAWGHAEHLIVAFYYALNNDFDTAVAKMRDGIIKLLTAFEIDLAKEMPYHETLTVFWMRTVYDFAKTKTMNSSVKTYRQLIETFDKNFPMNFYTRDVLFSDEARRSYVEPNLSENARHAPTS